MYLASNPDLIQVFGANEEQATRHYIDRGRNERRQTRFDPALYLASNPDLLRALGNDSNAALMHYINNGYRENRQNLFDPSNYLAANADLTRAFGSDQSAALAHYLNQGYRENRLIRPVAPRPVVIVDDYAASSLTSGIVAVGGSAAGMIETRGDADWFRVTLEAGQNYRFQLSGRAGGGGTLTDEYLALCSASGVPLIGDSGGTESVDAEFTYQAQSGGTYYLAASGLMSSDIGSYTLRVRQEDDYAGNASTSGRIAPDASASGNIEVSGDSDWFAVTLTAGLNYVFDLSSAALTSASFVVRNANGEVLRSVEKNSSADASLTFQPAQDGAYYLSVAGNSGGYSWGVPTGRYTVRERTPDDYAGSSATRGTLAMAGEASGTIETSADADWLAVELTAGLNYVFDATSQGLTNPLAGGMMTLCDAAGTGLSSASFVSYRDGSLNYQPTRSGTYYLAVTSTGFGSTATGNYRLRARGDDFSGDSGTTGRLAIGESVSGSHETAGDRDWFAITLDGGASYRFSMTPISSSRTGSSALLRPAPALRVMDSAGVAQAFSSGLDSDGAATVSFAPTRSGSYFLSAETSYSSTEALGAYRLSAAQTDDYPDNRQTSGRLTATAPLGGRFEQTGDRDWVAVELTARQSYAFTLNGAGSRATLSLYDDASNLSLGTLAAGTLRYTSTRTGTYYLVATADSTPASYTLSMTTG